MKNAIDEARVDLKADDIRPGDLLVRYTSIVRDLALIEIEVARYIVVDRVGTTPRNAPPTAKPHWTYMCSLLSFNGPFRGYSNKLGSLRPLGEYLFNGCDRWKVLVESGLSWEGEQKWS